MTFLVERFSELFSLLTVRQFVIDIASEISTRVVQAKGAPVTRPHVPGSGSTVRRQ